MRTLLISILLLCFAAGPVLAQTATPEDVRRAAKEEMDRIMRGGTPPAAPAPDAATSNAGEKSAKEPTPAAEGVLATRAETPATTTEVPAEKEDAVPPPCTPEKKDFSDKSPSIEKKYGRRQAEIDKMDANCDGVLQADELQKGIDARFEAADADKDGVLSQAESAAIIGQFKADEQEEYGVATDKKARKLEKRLDKADANEDGKISAEEYSAYYKKRYGKLDNNKDGILDVREFETDVEDKRNRPNTHN